MKAKIYKVVLTSSYGANLDRKRQCRYDTRLHPTSSSTASLAQAWQGITLTDKSEYLNTFYKLLESHVLRTMRRLGQHLTRGRVGACG